MAKKQQTIIIPKAIKRAKVKSNPKKKKTKAPESYSIPKSPSRKANTKPTAIPKARTNTKPTAIPKSKPASIPKSKPRTFKKKEERAPMQYSSGDMQYNALADAFARAGITPDSFKK
jgi:hypothetical protein